MRHFGRSTLLLAGLTAVGCVCTWVPGECGTNWPMWMENPTHTPTPQFEPSGPLRVEWTASCGGVFGSPVVYEGMVYFASRDGGLYAVQEPTGGQLWRVHLAIEGAELVERRGDPLAYWTEQGYQETGFIATPAVDEDRVYVGALDGHFHARDRLSGSFVWIQHVAAAMASSPVLLGDMVVVGTRGGDLVALAKADGEVRWTYQTGGPVNSSPAFADGKLIVGTSGGVVAVDAGTGQLVWEAGLGGTGKFDSSPCVAEGRVYAASWGGSVLALGLDDGEVLWEQQIAQRPIFASPAVAAGLVYVSTTDGLLVALQAETGDTAWQTELLGPRDRRVAAYGSPVVCGPVVLGPSNAGRVDIFGAEQGDWVSSITHGLWKYVHGTPVMTDEAIYVSSELPPSPGQGIVRKFACATDETPVRRPEFARMAAQALGVAKTAELPGAAEYGDWVLCADTTEADRTAVDQLVELGLLRRWARVWRRGDLRRADLAAFYYKLFAQPNPFRVELPEYEPAHLKDADEVPDWLGSLPQTVVGLGLLDAPEGNFGWRQTVTMGEVRASLARARELVDQHAVRQQ